MNNRLFPSMCRETLDGRVPLDCKAPRVPPVATGPQDTPDLQDFQVPLETTEKMPLTDHLDHP